MRIMQMFLINRDMAGNMMNKSSDFEQLLSGSSNLPDIVRVFTHLRHGKLYQNDFNYPEISCVIDAEIASDIGGVASKLTAALTIYMDSFLGLSTREMAGGDVEITARFSHLLSLADVANEIKLNAPDVIDCLMGV
jgi:hypothetical protein